MVSYLFSIIVLSVRWYVDNGASRHMTYDRKIFSTIQYQEGVMCVDLGDDVTYHVK